MTTQQDMSTHYTRGNLIATIRGGVESLGKTIDSVTVDDLAPVDEFHIGGRQASEHFIDQLGVTPDMHILDIGCGLGGPARFVTHQAHRMRSKKPNMTRCQNVRDTHDRRPPKGYRRIQEGIQK